MKQRFLHIFAFLMAIFIATPMANAAEYTFSRTESWTTPLNPVSGSVIGKDAQSYVQGAASDGKIFTLPASSNTSVYPQITYNGSIYYITQGYVFGNGSQNYWSSGTSNTATPYYSAGSYYYFGPGIAADDAGTLWCSSVRSTNPVKDSNGNNLVPWASKTGGLTYFTKRPAHPSDGGTRSGINLNAAGCLISARTDMLSAYGDGVTTGKTGHIWFAPEAISNVECVVIKNAAAVKKVALAAPVKNPNSRTYIKQISATRVMYNAGSTGDNTGAIYMGTIDNSDLQKATKISWENTGLKSVRHGATAFIVNNHEYIAYSKTKTTIAVYDYTEKEEILTFTPFTTTSAQTYVSHSIDPKVIGNLVELYVYVPGVGATKHTLTALYAGAVNSLTAKLVDGKASDITVSWAKPSAGTVSKYSISYTSTNGYTGTVEVTNLSHTFTNLKASTYTFKVKPYYNTGNWGEEVSSNTVTTITAPVTSLTASLEDPATNTIAVSWAKPSANATPEKYTIDYSTDNGTNWSNSIETANLSHSFSNLAAGTYIFRVRPNYSAYLGQSATSNSIEIVDAVTNLKVSRQCYGEGGNSAMGTVDALVTWTGVTGKEYKVYYQTMRRDESGNRVYDNGGAWVELGSITIASGSTAGSYTHKNIQPGDGYDRIYNYKVAPYYSSTGAIGQETIIEGKGKTITAFYQSVPVDVALTQPTEERDGKKLYTFNLQLEIALNSNFSATRLEDNDVMASISKYVIVVDETAAKWLNAASNASEVGTFVQGPVTVVANNCNHYSVDGWYLEVDIEDLKPTDDLSKGTKSLTWRNVNPGIVYQPQVYAISSRAFNFTNATATLANEPGAEAGKMVVPAPKWTLPNGNNVGITAVAGDFSSLVSNDHYPMGTFQKKGDITTPTNPITITEANTIGTIGATIEPIAIADEVIGTKNADGSYENWTWEIAYTFNLFEKNGDEWVRIRNSQKYGQISSDIETSSMYSNTQDLAFDLVGIPVGVEETTSPDGRSRLVYKPENNKEYKVVVETNYRRTVNGELIHVVGVSETIIALNPDFETPEIDEYKCPGYLFLEQSTHWDEGNKDDEGNYINGGYYKHYYDAVMNITLKEFQEDYVKYLGYYANPSFTCIGHPTATSNKWTPYQAASILIDEHVVLYNKRNPSFELKQLGYTGSEDWSKLITKSGTFPLKVHYVWAGNEKINAVDDAEFEFELSANYPILVASTPEFRINKSLIDNKHELAPANPLSRATNYTLQMITAVNEDYKTLVMDDVVETQLTTGVEAVAFDKGVLMVYPNPAQSEATIRSTTVLGEVKIFTIDGQLVKEFESGETTAKFNVSDLTSGVYVVSASGTTTRMIKK